MTKLRHVRSVFKAALLLIAAVPVAAQADTSYNLRVDSVGVQGGQMYIQSPNLPANCNGIAYLALSIGNSQQVLAVALAGRLNNAKLGRIDVSGPGQCTIDLIQL